MSEKIKRDAFLFLKGDDPRFAQCGTCAFGKDHCGVMGGSSVDPKIGSCGFYVEGNPIGIIVAYMTRKEVGYVERKVRCMNCGYFTKGTTCGLYQQLNEKFPDMFDLDENVSKRDCCNANTAKE